MPATDQLQLGNAFDDAFERLRKNAELVRQLRQATQDRAVTLANVKRFLDSTPSYKHLIILVDFDSLAAFVEGDITADEDLPFLSHFFLQSELSYGFPAGTERELINYLRRETLLPPEITDALVKRQVLRDIPSVAQLIYSFIDREEDLALRHKSMKVRRLLAVLTSERYLRGIHRPSTKAKEVMLQSLAKKARYKLITSQGRSVRSVDISRSERDENDADNLGVAFEKILEYWGRAEEWDQYFLLLTKTRVVDVVSSDWRAQAGFWLAVRPKLLFYADACGCRKHSRATQDVRKATEMLDELVRTLLKIETFGQNPAFIKEKDAALKETITLVKGLQSLAGAILVGIFPDLEASFAAVESTLRSTSSQDSGESEDQMNALEFRLHYIKQLEYLVASLEGNPAVTYSVVSVQDEPKWTLDCSDKRYNDQSFSVKAIEDCLSAQWNVCASDVYFSSAVSKIFGKAEEAWTSEALQDAWCGEVPDSSHRVLTEGIVWYTPLGVFGMRPGMIIKTAGWSILRINSLTEFLNTSESEWRGIFSERRQPMILYSLQALQMASLDVDQVRITTKTRSMLFDYRLNENNRVRRCSVSCKPRDSEWIADGYFHLGLRFCQKTALAKTLSQIS